MATPIKFDPPLVKDLKGNPGSVSFDSVEQAEAWLKEERDRWQRVLTSGYQQTNAHQTVRQRQREPMEILLSDFQNFRSHYSKFPSPKEALKQTFVEQLKKTVEGRLDFWAKKQVIHSESAEGQLVLGQDDDRLAMNVLMLLKRGNQNLLSDESFDVLSLLEAWHIVRGEAAPARAHLQSLEKAAEAASAALTKRAQDHEALVKQEQEQVLQMGENLKSLNQSVSNAVANAQKEVDGLKDRIKNDLEVMGKRTTEDFEAFRQAHKDMLAIQQPVDYWKEKAGMHFWNIVGWGTLFVILVAITVGAVVYLGVPRVQDLTKAIKADDLKTTTGLIELAVITVPLFFAVWLIRVCSRLLSLNVGLYWDAKERVAMATTFVALQAQSGGLKEAERAEVMKSLFRPAAVTGDDGAPALLETLLGKLASR